jgi:hypothetical protein
VGGILGLLVLRRVSIRVTWLFRVIIRVIRIIIRVPWLIRVIIRVIRVIRVSTETAVIQMSACGLLELPALS